MQLTGQLKQQSHWSMVETGTALMVFLLHLASTLLLPAVGSKPRSLNHPRTGTLHASVSSQHKVYIKFFRLLPSYTTKIALGHQYF